MENKKIKIKIVITNIKRIISSFLFINVMPLFNKVVLGFNRDMIELEPTCYAAPKEPLVKEEINLFVILVPIAIIIFLIIGLIIRIKKHKKSKTENINNDKKD